MTPLLSIIVLVLLASLGALLFDSGKTQNMFIKSAIYTGIVYLLVGLLLGPNVLGLLNREILDYLDIMVGFVLGWAGFLIGLQVNIKQMKRFQRWYYNFSLINFSLTVMSLTLIGLLYVNLTALNIDIGEIIIIAIIGSINSPIILAVMKREFGIRGKIIHLLEFNSAFDNILGIMAIGFVIHFFNVQGPVEIVSSVLYFIINIIAAGGLAGLFFFIIKEIRTDQQYLLLLIAFILILVGFAESFRGSTLFIAFVFGAIISNLPVNTWKLYHSIARLEKPIYLLLLIFFGLNINVFNIQLLLAVFVFSIVRLSIKSTLSAVYNLFKPGKINVKTGFAGISMGGISLALVLDYYITVPSEFSRIIIFIIGISFMLNDVFAVKISKYALDNK